MGFAGNEARPDCCCVSAALVEATKVGAGALACRILASLASIAAIFASVLSTFNATRIQSFFIRRGICKKARGDARLLTLVAVSPSLRG